MTIQVNKVALYGAIAVTAVILMVMAAHVLVTFVAGMVAARLIPYVPTFDQIRALTITRRGDDDLFVDGTVSDNHPIVLEEVRLRRHPRHT